MILDASSSSNTFSKTEIKTKNFEVLGFKLKWSLLMGKILNRLSGLNELEKGELKKFIKAKEQLCYARKQEINFKLELCKNILK
jgi:hypothetical protein